MDNLSTVSISSKDSNRDSEPPSEIDEAEDRQPAGQRWDPLGAANEETDLIIAHCDPEL